MMQPWQALLLGVVEGLTEFLPVSSTGHLILAAHWLGLHGEAVKTFEVVIQAGALAAVLGLYRRRVAGLAAGVLGRSPEGRRLLGNLALSFLPAAAAGLLLHRHIKDLLFHPWPVIAALAVGGVLMILIGRPSHWVQAGRSLDSLTWRHALVIGLAQCVALWPGTSRAMTTIVAALAVGLPATAAAEYSFLLAVPTLGAATLFDAAQGAGAIGQAGGFLTLGIGFFSAALVASFAIRGLLQSLTRCGLAPFGWYRLGLAAVVWWVHRGGP